mmetsp:Transcript_64182/g.150475  ORF Transcript_64182/g.150475 Transcript_64182/m.150475 type:complete len:201 (-) Transcript_64182:102-704(-)
MLLHHLLENGCGHFHAMLLRFLGKAWCRPGSCAGLRLETLDLLVLLVDLLEELVDLDLLQLRDGLQLRQLQRDELQVDRQLSETVSRPICAVDRCAVGRICRRAVCAVSGDVACIDFIAAVLQLWHCVDLVHVVHDVVLDQPFQRHIGRRIARIRRVHRLRIFEDGKAGDRMSLCFHRQKGWRLSGRRSVRCTAGVIGGC